MKISTGSVPVVTRCLEWQHSKKCRLLKFTRSISQLLSSVCVCVVFPFILDVRLVDVPAGATQEEGHTRFLIHLPSAVLALTFLARRIQRFLSLVDREVELLCINELIVL